MSENDVQIVRLEPMRVASAYGFGESPELEAWEKILDFARSKGLLEQPGSYRFFGFNNPNPSPGSPNYGYEQWITVGPEIEAEGDIEIKEFPGGLYATTRCEGVGNIEATWRRLLRWFEDSAYTKPPNFLECLEELLTPPSLPYEEYVFDLYLPIAQ